METGFQSGLRPDPRFKIKVGFRLKSAEPLTTDLVSAVPWTEQNLDFSGVRSGGSLQDRESALVPRKQKNINNSAFCLFSCLFVLFFSLSEV